MTAQLAEISQAVAPGAHAVLLLDQAGWHVSPKLPVPANITLLPLPPRSPELNPVENIWQFVRDNWAVEPDFRLLRRNPRSRLRRVEQARRPALDHYVHRTARLGSRVLISARRYQASLAAWMTRMALDRMLGWGGEWAWGRASLGSAFSRCRTTSSGEAPFSTRWRRAL
jgi:hypothetical protein